MTYKFVEKLDLVFEFSVLVNAHSRVRRLRGDKLEERVDRDTLDKLAVTFKSLQLLILALLDAPEN